MVLKDVVAKMRERIEFRKRHTHRFDDLEEFADELDKIVDFECADHWYAEVRYLEGKLEQANRAYEIVANERDGYRNVLHKVSELQAEAEMLKPRIVVIKHEWNPLKDSHA